MFEQIPEVPVTVYVVVAVGDTICVAPAPSPLFQEYVAAPELVIVVELPAQIVVEPVANTIGNGVTVTVTVITENCLN